jgi:hypothetical protein
LPDLTESALGQKRTFHSEQKFSERPKSLCQEKPDSFSIQFTRSCQVIARASASINVAGTAGEFRMPSNIVRNSARSDDNFDAQPKLEFDQWRTAIALVQRLREAGIGCELFSALQNRN